MYLVVPPGGCFSEERRIELGPGPLTIGRAEACEIRVDVPGVDQTHARISEIALIALGPDCAVGDVPLDPGARRLVMPGDEIQIGSVVVALEGTDPSLVPPRPDSQGSLRLGNPHVDGARVRVVEGATFGDELLLLEDGREYVIGRGASCDLVLDDREVSREHVKLVRRGHGIFLQDLSSTRGSWLGRSAVYTGATVEWTRPRMLRVGATVLSLELPEAARRAAPAAQASAPMTPPPRPRTAPMPSAQATQPLPAIVGSAAASVEPPSSQPPSARRPTDSAGADGLPARRPFAMAMAMPSAIEPAYGAEPMVVPSAPPSGVDYAAPISTQGDLVGRAAPNQSRKAWKKTGPTFGKATGLLLLALAALVLLGGIFVVFSLLE